MLRFPQNAASRTQSAGFTDCTENAQKNAGIITRGPSLEVMQIVTVFSMKSRVEIMAIHYCMLELVFFKVLSHSDTVHVAARRCRSESAFIRYPGSDEIVTGSPQNSAYM